MPDAYGREQDAEPRAVHAAVVRYRAQVGGALRVQCADQVARDAAQSEAVSVIPSALRSSRPTA